MHLRAREQVVYIGLAIMSGPCFFFRFHVVVYHPVISINVVLSFSAKPISELPRVHA